MPVDTVRPVTARETAILRWLLDRAPVGDVTAYRSLPLDPLRVTGCCKCGCASLDFALDTKHAGIIADAYAVYPDGQVAGLILWGRGGEIVSLEVYDCHPEASRRAPEVADLRTFEEYGTSQG